MNRYILMLAVLVCATFAAKASDDIITRQPEGTLHATDFRIGQFFTYSYDTRITGKYENYIGTYVEGTDGSLYLRNPITQFSTGSWLKIDKAADGRYVAHLPQPLYNDNGVIYYANRLTYRLQDDGTYTYEVDENGTDVYFTYVNGTLTMQDSTYETRGKYPQVIIGLVDENGGWTDYGDGIIKIEPNNETPATKPASLAADDYELRTSAIDVYTGEYSTKRDYTLAAIDGNDVYLNVPPASSLWIKGTLDGSTATFLPQYMGIDTKLNQHFWFNPQTYTDKADSTYYDYTGEVIYLRNYALADKLVLHYDAATGRLSSDFGTSIGVSPSPVNFYIYAAYDKPEFVKSADIAATPATPSLEITEYDPAEGYGHLTVTIPTTDVDGNFLNTSKLYYDIYVDDPTKPYVFNTDGKYRYLDGTMTDIPYDFTDNYDFNSGGNEKTVFFYFDTANVDSIGVQTVYRAGGEERRSSIAWKQTEKATAINGVTTDNADNVRTEYFDLSGRRVSVPQAGGVYIKEMTYPDGNRKNVKFIKK